MNIRSNVQGVTVLFMAIMLVSFILYWPHSQMGYVLDDYYVIEQNPAVKSFSFEKVLNAGLFDSAHRSVDSQLNYYRPVLTASFALDKICWGLNPFAQRIVNLIVHFGNCFLVFALFNLLFKKPNRSAIAAILFCILPIQEWSVRYIVGRGDLLMLFFSLLSVICLIHFLDRSRKIWLWVSLLFFVAAVLSKESALLNVGLVFTVVLYHSKEFKRAVVLSGFFGIAAIAYYFARLEFYPIHAGAVFSLDQFFIGMKEALIYMLRYLMPWSAQQIIPSGFSIGLVWVLSCAGLLLVGISRAKESAQDWACVRFGVIWLLVGSAVFLVTHHMSGRLGPVLSEHFLYLGSVGFVLLMAVMIDNVSNPLLKRILFCGFVFYFLMVSSLNGFFWKSEEYLLRHVQRLEGRSFTVAYEQLAMRYDDDMQKVIQLLGRAKTGSSQSLWLRRIGDLYRKQKKYPEAKSALARAVDLNPQNIEAINELAVCHLETGQFPIGMKLLGYSLLISPQQSDAFKLMGIVYYRTGQFAPAIGYLKQAWANDPDQTETALYLMMAFYFVNDQVAYLESVDRISDRTTSPDVVLRFAANELFLHGYYKETVKVISQSQTIFLKDPAMKVLFEQAQRRISALPK